jgi:hypothetical protein
MFHEEHMQAHRRQWKAMSGGKKALVLAGWVALIAAGLAVFGLVIMLLWNRVMSGVLGLPALGFWDAVGLFILAKILLGGRPGAFIGKMRMRRIMRERMAAEAAGTGEGEGLRD